MSLFWEKHKWDVYLFIAIAVVLFVVMCIVKAQLTDQAAYYVFGYPPIRDPRSPEYALANANTPCVVLPEGIDKNNITPYNNKPTPMCYRDNSIRNKASFKERLTAWLAKKPADGSNLGKPYESSQQCNSENGITKTASN